MTAGTEVPPAPHRQAGTRREKDPVVARAVRLVDAWSRTAAAPHRRVPRFPFAEAAAAVRAHGTHRLPDELTATLSAAAEAARRRAGAPPGEAWYTAQWLHHATSMATGDQSYASYTMCGLLDQYCRTAGGGSHRGRARVLSAVLVADLLRHELARTPRLPARRTAVAVRLTADLCAMAGRGARPSRPVSPAAAVRLNTWLIRRLCRGQSALLPLVVASTPLPATTEPDEYLFSRSVQAMEILANIAASHAELARRRCRARDVAGVLAELRGLDDTLVQAAKLFRVLSSIDPGQFAGIRAATYGTGALQSPGFAALERSCLGASALRPETVAAVPPHRSPVPARALGEALTDLLHSLPEREGARLAEVRAAVDITWVRWKRVHRGVADRVIGDVPGTGGSDGVAYLRRHMDVPLLTAAPPPPPQEDVRAPHEPPGVPGVRPPDGGLGRRLLGAPGIAASGAAGPAR